MKTIELEKQKYLRQMSVAFPKKDSPGFSERVIQISKDLNSDIYAARLSRELKPGRGSTNRATIFYLWLILCLERPWEKGWKYHIGKRKKGDIWTEITNILVELPGDFENYLNTSTIKKYLKREDFDKVVSWAAIDPKIFNKIGRPLARKIAKFNKAMKLFAKRFKKIDTRRTKLVIKFIKLVSSEKHISKRDLMRKLGINKKDCDSLLREAESQGLIKVKKYSNNSVWIIYTGP